MSPTYNIKLLKNVDEKKWDDFVIRNKESTFYHQCGWKRAIENIYGHKSSYLSSENEAGEINGIFPLFSIRDLLQRKRLVSIPFAPYGGICSEAEEIKAALMNEAIRMGEDLGASVIELRCCNNKFNNFNCVEDYSTFKLNLSNGIKYIWDHMEKTVRTAIRKGEKNSLEFTIEKNKESMEEFYNIYSKKMKLLGTPVHDYRFFSNIRETFPDSVFVARAVLNERTISSLLLLKFKDTLIYGWGSSLNEYLSLAPNNFIHWNAIKYASEQGLLWYDFGRSLNGSGNYNFKKRWGSIEIPINSCFYPGIKKIDSPQMEYEKFSTIWSKVPLRVTKLIGPIIRKYVV